MKYLDKNWHLTPLSGILTRNVQFGTKEPKNMYGLDVGEVGTVLQCKVVVGALGGRVNYVGVWLYGCVGV